VYRLTDEVIRQNYEEFGHPDGKQDFSMGIALPSWVVESRNVGWVMGAYAILLGVMLPLYVVGSCCLESRASNSI
jgi:translocation protein SEC63